MAYVKKYSIIKIQCCLEFTIIMSYIYKKIHIYGKKQYKLSYAQISHINIYSDYLN